MRGSLDVCGCFPTGRHYPGIADRLANVIKAVVGLAAEIEATARWADVRIAVIDFETTGFSADNDRIVEIGVACFEAGKITLLKNWLLNPGMPIPEASRAVHGISDADVVGSPAFVEVATELAEALRGHLPVAYNASFDRGFLHAELRRAGVAMTQVDGAPLLPPAFQSEVVWLDPLVWARELHHDAQSKKLVDMCARLGITLENAHRAASDAEAAGRVLLALAERMPVTYTEVIGLQAQYAARQDLDFQQRRRKS